MHPKCIFKLFNIFTLLREKKKLDFNNFNHFSFIIVFFQEIIPRVYKPGFLVYIGLAVAMLLFLIIFLVFLCLR